MALHPALRLTDSKVRHHRGAKVRAQHKSPRSKVAAESPCHETAARGHLESTTTSWQIGTAIGTRLARAYKKAIFFGRNHGRLMLDALTWRKKWLKKQEPTPKPKPPKPQAPQAQAQPPSSTIIYQPPSPGNPFAPACIAVDSQPSQGQQQPAVRTTGSEPRKGLDFWFPMDFMMKLGPFIWFWSSGSKLLMVLLVIASIAGLFFPPVRWQFHTFSSIAIWSKHACNI